VGRVRVVEGVEWDGVFIVWGGGRRKRERGFSIEDVVV
jgi:hypothetical protein